MADLSDRTKILNRKGALWNERSSWFNHWREISELLMPRTGRFFTTDRNNGQKKHSKIIASSGTKALRVLSAGLMAGMTSPARPWFRLGTSDLDLMEYGPVKVWLNNVTLLMRRIFEKGNTYRALHSIYEELGAYGTAASIILPDFENVMWHYPLTIGEYAISTDYRGQVNTLYREFEMTVAQMVQEFGIENVSPQVKNLYDTGKGLDAWRPVLHVIEPRLERDYAAKDAKNMPYKSCYLEMGRNDDVYLRESGFERFPALVPRWHATGGDIYGNSPGMEALGDVKQLQHSQLRKGQALDYKVKPPLQIPASLKNVPYSTLPGGVAYFDATGPQNSIRSMFDVNLSMAEQLEDIRDMRDAIDKAFYVDLFMMIARDDRTGVTAREVAERHEEKLLMLGPVLERLHNELLKPFIDVTFDRIIEANLVPPPPPELQGMDLNVDFISMLAQAQRAVGITGVDRMLQTVGTIATFQMNAGKAPEALDKLDTDQIIDAYAEMLGVDPTLIVADEKVAIVRQQRAAQQQAAQQQQQAAQAAQTAQTLSDTNTTEDNALTDVIGRFSGYGGAI
jgi:hypothetical protein